MSKNGWTFSNGDSANVAILFVKNFTIQNIGFYIKGGPEHILNSASFDIYFCNGLSNVCDSKSSHGRCCILFKTQVLLWLTLKLKCGNYEQ